jgi:FkbM family methyltransferase
MAHARLKPTALFHPAGSRVSTRSLLEEVEEYFDAGATVPEGGTVVDVGANVGAFGLRVAEQCGGNVRLLCFEPCPSTFAALERNFASHPLLHRTLHTLHPVGLSSLAQAGQSLAFFNTRRFPTNSTFDLPAKRREFELACADRGERWRRSLERFLPGRWGRALARWVARALTALPKGRLAWWVMRLGLGLEETLVPVDTLDAALSRVARVDLLKVDVEGYELRVLEGLGESSWPKIQQLVLETHDRDGRLDRVRDLLVKNGLSQIRVSAQAAHDNGLHSLLVWAGR